MFLRMCGFASFSLERMLLPLTSGWFFLNDSSNCISCLGSHIFLSHLGKIQPFLTLSQQNHISSPSCFLWLYHTSSFSGFLFHPCPKQTLLLSWVIISTTPLFCGNLSLSSPLLHQTHFLSSPSTSFTTNLQSGLFWQDDLFWQHRPQNSDSILTLYQTAVSVFFPHLPPQLGRALQKHLQRGFGAERPDGTTCSLLLRGFICLVSLILKIKLPWEMPFFASAHWGSEKWQPGVHPKPTHFRFWCHLKATQSPHWCSALSAVVGGGSLSNTHKQCQVLEVNLQLARSCRQHAEKNLFPLSLHTSLKGIVFSESQLRQTCWKRFSLDLYYGSEEHERPLSVQSIIFNF